MIRKTLIINLITILVFATLNFAQIDSFLSWGVSSKAIAMGRAQTAVSDDGASLFYNPALVSKVKTFEFLGNYSIFYENSSYAYLSFISPTPYGSLGIAVQNLYVGDILLRNIYGRPLGTTDSRLTSIYLAFGSNLSELFLPSDFITLYSGLSCKIISEKLYNLESGGISLDLGFQSDLDFSFYKLLLGTNLSNILATKVKLYSEEEIPFIFRFGIGLLLFDESFKIATDMVYSKQINSINLGIEYTLWKLFSMRCGVNNTDISLGFGITRQNIQFNYAFVISQPWANIDFGMLHTIDFKIKWTIKKKR